MTRGSVLEFAEAMRGLYLKAGGKEKGKTLDTFTEVNGYHRKAAVRLLLQDGTPKERKRRTQRRYGPDVVDPLRKIT